MLSNFNKQDRRLLSISVILLLIFSFLLYDDSLLMDLIVGHGRKVANVIKSDNDVRQKYAADFRWISVHEAQIYENDSVFTGSNSEATIILEDKTEIHLKENTLVTFRTMNGQLVLGLQYGQVSGDTSKIKIEEPSERKPAALSIVSVPVITSPEAYSKKQILLNLKGERDGDGIVHIAWKYEKNMTQFEIEISKTPDFTTIEFNLKVTEKKLTSPDLKEGTYFTRVREAIDEKTFGKWSKPVQFDITHLIPDSLPTPELITKVLELKFEDQASPKIEWKPVEGANDYIVEIYNQADLKQTMQFKSGQSSFVLKDKKPGFYHFHVIAHNDLGIQSLPSEKGELNVKTNAPILVPVPPKKYIAQNKSDKGAPTKFNLKWSEVPNSDSYLIEISKTSDFQDAKKYQARSPASVAEIPGAGKYLWRVRSISASGQPISDFSQPGDILYTYESPLAPPALKEPLDQMTLFFQKKNQNSFHLEWAKVQHATQYSIEIAKDPLFKEVVFKKQVSSARYLLKEVLPSGDLFWRVRSEAPQRLSQWSESRKMSVFGGRTARGQ